MKKILITPSVITFKKKNLIFNLEKNWFDYSKKLNFVIEIIDYNNFKKQIKNADGIIFSGGNGNDLYRYKKTYKNKFREYNEKKILSFVKKKKFQSYLFVMVFNFWHHLLPQDWLNRICMLKGLNQ